MSVAIPGSIPAQMSRSIEAMEAVVQPAFTDLLGIDHWIRVEGVPDYEYRDLDSQFGVDYICRSGGTVWSLAARVQFPPHHTNQTFTIRYRLARDRTADTEWQKRTKAIDLGGYCPDKTLQAYIDDAGRLRHAAMVDTRTLYEVARSGVTTTKEVEGGNWMKVVNWSRFDPGHLIVAGYHPVRRHTIWQKGQNLDVNQGVLFA